MKFGLEVDGFDVQRSAHAADAADDVRPHQASESHHQHRKPRLVHVVGSDIPVSDGCDCHGAPVQAGSGQFKRSTSGDNDNDNDTLREVPHPSNEGLALQARVSGPWPHKKESVLLVELARWQTAQVQTVKRQNVVQRYLK